MVNEAKAMETKDKKLTGLEPPIIRDPAYETDVGNARRLVDNMKGDGRYCYPWKSWMFWTGRRWEQDNTGQIVRCAKATVQKMREESESIGVSDLREKHLKHATASESYPKIMAMVKLAESEIGVPILPDVMDRGIFLLNVQNGTLDLQTGKLREHHREDYLTKMSPVVHDEKAECPQWIAFINQIFQCDEELIKYIQKIAGRALTGDASERHIYMFWGTGANGKSTLVETIGYILGEYAISIGIDSLLSKNKKSIPNDIARLKGARFVYASEPDFGEQISEGKVKSLTGKDTIQARFLQQEYFEFKPEYKLVVSTNHKPGIKGMDNGIWSRVKLVPFLVTIPDHLQDKNLDTKLRAEASGILNWMIEGCKLWQKEGMHTPDIVTEATREYQDEMDTLAEFIDGCCIRDETESVPNTHLYKIFMRWCEYSKSFKMTEKSFTQAMAERGFPTKKIRGSRCKVNLRLKDYLAHVMEQIDNGEQPDDYLDKMDIGKVLKPSEDDSIFERAVKILKETWDHHNAPEKYDVERIKSVMKKTLMQQIEELDEDGADRVIAHYFKVQQW